MGQPPLALTFQRFERPEIAVVKTISLPLRDQVALETERVKYRSSMGSGRAAGLDSELSDFGSVICRVSGPEDCAKQEAQSERASRQRNVVRTEFIRNLG